MIIRSFGPLGYPLSTCSSIPEDAPLESCKIVLKHPSSCKGSYKGSSKGPCKVPKKAAQERCYTSGFRGGDTPNPKPFNECPEDAPTVTNKSPGSTQHAQKSKGSIGAFFLKRTGFFEGFCQGLARSS